MNLTIGCKIEQQYYLMNGEPLLISKNGQA